MTATYVPNVWNATSEVSSIATFRDGSAAPEVASLCMIEAAASAARPSTTLFAPEMI
jgi:hypothetical protein